MSPSRIVDFIRMIKAQRGAGLPPYTLFLGSNASISSGSSDFAAILRDLVEDESPEGLYQLLRGCRQSERAALLRPHLGGAAPSQGYLALAQLIKAGFFNVILTTNVDKLLETSLIQVGLKPADYVCLTLGRDREEEIARLVRQPQPRVKILKLHGDLDSGILLLTPEETFQFPEPVGKILKDLFDQNVLIAACGAWDSNDVVRCFGAAGSSTWFAGSPPAPGSFLYQVLAARGSLNNVIGGAEGEFDRFFEALAARLVTGPPGDTAPEVLDYVNFNLEISRAAGSPPGSYQARAGCALTGASPQVPFLLSVRPDEVANLAGQVGLPPAARVVGRKALSSEDQSAAALGRKLFDAVFQRDILDRWQAALQKAQARGQGLRIRLVFAGTPELAELPWEYLYPGPERDFLCLSRYTVVTRGPLTGSTPTYLHVKKPLRILGIISSPADLQRLNTEKERSLLQQALAVLCQNGQVQLDWLENPSLLTLRQALTAGGDYHILHFIGHGAFDAARQDGLVALVGPDGRSDRVYSTTLARTLKDCQSLRLIVLNTCEGAVGGGQDPFGSVADTLIRQGIPAVIAMQFPISDQAAITFSQSFYSQLGRGWPVDAALAEARLRVALDQRQRAEWGTPRLYLHSAAQDDPAIGKLFQVS